MKQLPGPRRHRGPLTRFRSFEKSRLRARPRLPPLDQGRKREPRRRVQARGTEGLVETPFEVLVVTPETRERAAERRRPEGP